jgi:hypothetical protein
LAEVVVGVWVVVTVRLEEEVEMATFLWEE